MSDSIAQMLREFQASIHKTPKTPGASYGLTHMDWIEEQGVYQWKVVDPVTERTMFSGEAKTANEAHAAAQKIERELGDLIDRTRNGIYPDLHQLLWSLEMR